MKMSKSSRKSLLIAIGLLALTLIVIKVGTDRLARPATKVEIAVLNQDVPRGTQITKNMIQNVYVSEDAITSNMLYKEEDMVGKYALVNLYEGDLVNHHYVSSKDESFNTYVLSMDADKLAFSISLDGLAESVSAQIQKGDVVQVFSVSKDQSIQNVYLQAVKIIGVFDEYGNEIIGEQKYTEKDLMPDTAILEVTREQANLLNTYQSDGGIHLTILARTGEENTKKLLEQQELILEGKAESSEE